MVGQRPALSGPLHVLGHVILVGAGWVIFCGFWYVTLFRQPLFPVELTLLVAGSLLLGPLVTLYWVLHNRRIHARKGPRRAVAAPPETYSQDWAGRPVKARFDSLRGSSVVVIRSTPDEKHFLTAGDMLLANGQPLAREPFAELRQAGAFLAREAPVHASVPPQARPPHTAIADHDPAPAP